MIVRIVCYAALAIVVAGAAGLFAPLALDLCANRPGSTAKCVAPIFRIIHEFGYTVILVTVFTGLPGLLALGGVVFLVRDVFWRRRTAG